MLRTGSRKSYTTRKFRPFSRRIIIFDTTHSSYWHQIFNDNAAANKLAVVGKREGVHFYYLFTLG